MTSPAYFFPYVCTLLVGSRYFGYDKHAVITNKTVAYLLNINK